MSNYQNKAPRYDYDKAKVGRSRVTNGSKTFLGQADGRSEKARRWRDIYGALADPLGGDEEMTESLKQLCRRAATLSVVSEEQEAALVSGEDVDVDAAIRLTRVLTRLLVILDLQLEATPLEGKRRRYIRRKDEPTLENYLSNIAEKRKARRPRLLLVDDFEDDEEDEE